MRNMTAAAAALMTLAAMPALAVPALPIGQYVGITQYTSLIDPFSLCANGAGLAVGQVTTSVATLPQGPGTTGSALGAAWTDVIAATGDGTLKPYGITSIACSFANLPTAAQFGTLTKSKTFVYKPATGSETTTCTTSTGTQYTLTSSNQAITSGTSTIQQGLTITLIQNPAGSGDHGLQLNTQNTAVAVGGTVVCYLSASQLYLNGTK